MPAMRTLARRALDRYRSEGAAETARATLRHIARHFGGSEFDEPIAQTRTRPLREVDFSAYRHIERAYADNRYEVILATDLRFLGGSGHSSAEELDVQSRHGIATGIYHLPTRLMNHRKAITPAMDQAIRGGKADLLNGVVAPLRTKLLLFRHPTVLNPGGAPLPEVEAEHVALVVNHVPIKFNRIEYLLPHAARRLRESYGVQPAIYPIGPLIRSAIEEAYDGTVALAEEDWVNVFDLDRFETERRPPAGRTLRIGRHSRPNPEKWPADPQVIRAAYPKDDGIEVHVLGGADVPESLLGGRPRNWRVHEYGAIDPAEFLKGIDVFVYFHHPDWLEAFGRVIVEAMAASLPVVLPPHFRPLLGDAAIYCAPEEVRTVLERLRDPEVYRRYAEASCNAARARFGHRVHLSRLARFGAVGKTAAVIDV